MRLALLLGANPQAYQTGHTCILKPGKWKIVAEGVSDSIIKIKNHSLSLSIHEEFELGVHTGFSVEFEKRGNERVVSVFAERI